jgi:hypothetical protein
MAGLVVTGAAIPAVLYARHERDYDDGLEAGQRLTPDEATVDAASASAARFADQLRGIWDLRLTGVDHGILGLPANVELLLDVGPSGRAVRGYLGLPSTLRSEQPAEYRVQGDLTGMPEGQLRWRLLGSDGVPRYEFRALLDEVWGSWSDAGSASLNGRIVDLQRPLAQAEQDCQFVAIKRAFPEARERTPLAPALLAWLVSAEHRLFHQLWHASRDKWRRLDPDKRSALRGLGWQPGPRNAERGARGRRKHLNGSGEDFFFMHRHMLARARALQPDLPSWHELPQPPVFIEHDRQAFIRYHDNHDGNSVPPAWVVSDDEELSQWLAQIKADNSHYSNFQVWESQYQDPEYLSRLTLAQFGSEVELNIHDWLHMRWATVTRDPSNGMPVTGDREQSDYATRWFRAENDFLGDPFSSHINPVFWRFHAWLDARIEDWYRAHQRYHPGEVLRREVNGVNWFAPGRWVEVADPWLGPLTHGCGNGEQGGVAFESQVAAEMEVEVMKLGLRIALSGEEKVPDLLKRSPRRPWYARNLKLTDSPR